MAPTRILNVDFLNVTRGDFVGRLSSGFVVPLNVDTLMRAQWDREYYDICRTADHVLADSQIVVFASRVLGTPIVDRVSGSDVLPAYCELHVDDRDARVYLLGGADGVAALARENINRRLGRQIVVGARSPSFGFERDPEETAALIADINATGATVLAVGVGAPKQEKWIARHRAEMPGVHIFMAVGATLDFQSGRVQRAPSWASDLGIEWLFRLVREPRRLWRRYLVDDTGFFRLILDQRLHRYRDPFAAMESS